MDEENGTSGWLGEVVWLALPLLALGLAVLSAPVVATALIAASTLPDGYTGPAPMAAGAATTAALVAVVIAGIAGGVAGTAVARRHGSIDGLLVALWTAWPVAVVAVPVGLWLGQQAGAVAYLCIGGCTPLLHVEPDPSLAALIRGCLTFGAWYLGTAVFGLGFAVPLGAVAFGFGTAAQRRRGSKQAILKLAAATMWVVTWAAGNAVSISFVPTAAAALLVCALVWAAACSLARLAVPPPRGDAAQQPQPVRGG